MQLIDRDALNDDLATAGRPLPAWVAWRLAGAPILPTVRVSATCPGHAHCCVSQQGNEHPTGAPSVLDAVSVLDELRNELHYYLDGIGEDYCRDSVARELFRRFDAFEAAHPGLVDQTVACAACGIPTISRYEVWNTQLNRMVGELCPACAKEANGE